MLDDVGDPLLDHHRQMPRRVFAKARIGGEAPRQTHRARDGGRVRFQPRAGLRLVGRAKLGYGFILVGWEAGMRVAIAAGLLMAAGLSTASAAEIGRIKSVTGDAAVVRGKATSPATAGELLQVSDVIKTGPAGRIGITFVDNSRFAVGPNSQIALSQFEFDDTTHAGKSLTTVNRGVLAVVSGQIAHENKDAMRVRTPTALLAARGTRFVVEVNP
jgi:hypothetical protein